MGPYDDDYIIFCLEKGKFSYDDLCWQEGWSEWRVIKSIFSQSANPTFSAPQISPVRKLSENLTPPAQQYPMKNNEVLFKKVKNRIIAYISNIQRFPFLTFIRWAIRGIGGLFFIIAFFFLLAALSPDHSGVNLPSPYPISLISCPAKYVQIGFGVGFALLGACFFITSEVIGLIMAAEHSLFRMATTLELFLEAPMFQASSTVGAPTQDRSTTPSIESAGESLKKAFGSNGNAEDKYRPK
jgi:hypothetical protein